MSTDASPSLDAKDVERGKHDTPVIRNTSVGSIDKGEVFSLQDVDPALNAKMHLVNDVRLGRSHLAISDDGNSRQLMELGGLTIIGNFSCLMALGLTNPLFVFSFSSYSELTRH